VAIIKSNSENIRRAANKLKYGGLVAFPTETVYGLGADGLSPIAVSKIFEAKKRPTFNPLILHVSSIEMLNNIAKIKSEKIKLLTENFWPGALTLVLDKKDVVPYIVTSGFDTVAVRMPNNKIALDLINEFGRPIAAPSANSFGRLSPTKAEHVNNQLGDNVDIILDGGSCSIGVESTILEITNSDNFLLRPGGIPIEDIEEIVGKVTVKNVVIETPNSPGQLIIHYAPKIPIQFYDENKVEEYRNLKLGGIFLKEIMNETLFRVTKILSPKGEYREAASNLFTVMHDLENQNLDMILVEPIEKVGLGTAIMDRLTKAVNKYS